AAVARALPGGGRFAFTVEEGRPLTSAERNRMPDADTVWLVPVDELEDMLVRNGLAVRWRADWSAEHRATAASLLAAFVDGRDTIASVVGRRAADELVRAHRLWVDWLGRRRVRKLAFVAERCAAISFRTTAPTRAVVRLSGGALVDAGRGVDHVARLRRLTPGRRYAYSVRSRSGLLAQGSFRAAPAGRASFTFAVVGDFGSGTSNEAAVASLIESWHPDFVLTVGDNAYPEGAADLLDRDIFGPYAAVMRESAWFPALGNHDVKADGGKPELAAFHSLGNERWYRFGWGDAGIVVLDSDSSVAPGSSQLRFAQAALAMRSCFRFAAWHHPPW